MQGQLKQGRGRPVRSTGVFPQGACAAILSQSRPASRWLAPTGRDRAVTESPLTVGPPGRTLKAENNKTVWGEPDGDGNEKVGSTDSITRDCG